MLPSSLAHSPVTGHQALLCLVIILVTAAASHVVPRVSLRLAGVSPTLAGMVRWMLVVVVWVVGLSVTLAVLHVPNIPFFSLSTLALSFSLGAQQLVANVIDGVILVSLGRIKVGMQVQITGSAGTITEVHALYLRITAADGSIHDKPYTEVFTATIVHLSASAVARLKEAP